MNKRSLIAAVALFCSCEPVSRDNCVPGKTESCPCLRGYDGTQTCKDDGSGWSECICNCAWAVTPAPAPNIMLAIDKSGSMTESLSVGGSVSKLEAVGAALTVLLQGTASEVRFGFMQYPADRRCTPGTISVDCDVGTSTAIRQVIDALSAGGGNPVGGTIANASSSQALQDATRNSFMVLLTDGCPNCPNGNGSACSEADQLLAVESIQAARLNGVELFALGIGEDLNIDNPGFLNPIAIAGGRPRLGAVSYYAANTEQELHDSLMAIVDVATKCTVGSISQADMKACLLFMNPVRSEAAMSSFLASPQGESRWQEERGLRSS